MKAKHHFWSSLTTGSALFALTGSPSSLAGAMIGGFLIDGDHILDHLWSMSRGAPLARKEQAKSQSQNGRALRGWALSLMRRRKLVRLPLVLHSYELLAVLTVQAMIFRTPFLVGLTSGYALHIALDLIRHYHEFQSPLFYSLAYRIVHRFRRNRLIKQEYL